MSKVYALVERRECEWRPFFVDDDEAAMARREGWKPFACGEVLYWKRSRVSSRDNEDRTPPGKWTKIDVKAFRGGREEIEEIMRASPKPTS